jgi:hypothetical protein
VKTRAAERKKNAKERGMRRDTGLLIMVSALVAGAAQAAEIQITEDAFIRNGTYTNSNYGANNTTRVRSHNPGATCKTYLEVDVTSALSTGQTFINAKVKLTAAATAAWTGPIGLRIYGIVDNSDVWEEGAVTWANAPKNDTGSNFAPLDAGVRTVLLGTVIVKPGQFNAGSVWTFSGAELDRYLNWTAGNIADPYGNGASTDKKATFIIGAVQTGPNFDFYSSENREGNGPVLSYEVESVPIILGMVFCREEDLVPRKKI